MRRRAVLGTGWVTLFLITLAAWHYFSMLKGWKIPTDRDNLCFFYPLLTIFNWGRFPLWNPFQLSGSSLVADPQAALFYPPNWLLFGIPSNVGFGLSTLFHYVLAGTGTWFLGKRMGLKNAPALVAAVTYMLGGYMQARILLRPLLLSAAWIPWVLFFVLRALESGRNKEWAIASIFLALCFLPGMYHNGVYAAGGVLLFSIPAFCRSGNRRGRIGGLLLLGLLCVGLIGPSLFPVMEVLPYTARTDFTYEAASGSSLPWKALPQAFLGAPPRRDLPDWAFYEMAAFPGWAGLILAGIGIFLFLIDVGTKDSGRGKTAQSFRTGYWILLWVGAFLFALGPSGGIHRLFYHLPGGRFFNNPSRALVLCSLSFAMLAGIGSHRLCGLTGKGREAVGTALGGILVLAQVMGFSAYRSVLRIDFIDPAFEPPPPAVAWLQTHMKPEERLVTFDALRTIGADIRWQRFRPMLLPKVAMIDRLRDISGYDPLHLSHYADLVRGLSGQAPGEMPLRVVMPGSIPPRLAELLHIRTVLGEPHERLVFEGPLDIRGRRKEEFPFRWDGTPCLSVRLHAHASGMLTVPEGEVIAVLRIESSEGIETRFPLRAGIEIADRFAGEAGTASGHSPAQAYRRFLADHEGTARPAATYDCRLIFAEPITPQRMVLEGNRYEGQVTLWAAVFEGEHGNSPFELVFQEGPYRIYHQRGNLPRAWMVSRLKTARNTAEALAILSEDSFNPWKEAVLMESTVFPTAESLGSATVEYEEKTPTRHRIRISSSGGGLLVVSQIHAPGWQARIDGRAAPIHRVNVCLMGLYLEPGDHGIDLVYFPMGLKVGLFTAVVAGTGVLLVILWGWSRRSGQTGLGKNGGKNGQKGFTGG